MTAYRLLGIAAATGKIGYALLEGEHVADWGLLRKASRSPNRAAAKVRTWIELLKPEAVISEQLTKKSRKRGKTIALLAAITKAARKASVVHATVPRVRLHKNKYEEAATLVKRYPELRSRLPEKPPIWLPEPPNLIIFEALALALSVQLSDER